MFRLLIPSRCREGLALLSPLCCSGSRLCYMELPCAAHGSIPRVFHKSPEQKAAPAFCVFPVRAAQAARGLTGALSPGATRLLSPAPVPACALCLATTLPADVDIQNLRRSLIRNWRPVCSVVGAAVLGAEHAHFPYPLPPVSHEAGPFCHLQALLWTCLVPLFCERPAVCSGG